QLNKSDECADRCYVSNYLPAAIPDDQGNSDGSDYFDRRIEYGVVKDRIYIGLPVSLVDLVEPAHLLVFAVKELNDLHSGYVLLEKCIDPGNSHPHLAERRAGPKTEPGGQGPEQRQYCERHQRKPPVHLKHPDQDVKYHRDVAKDRDDPGSEHLIQRVDVSGQSRHEPANGVPVVEFDRKPLQMGKYLAAKVVHYPLAHRLQDDALSILNGKCGDAGGQEHQRYEQDSPVGVRAEAKP